MGLTFNVGGAIGATPMHLPGNQKMIPLRQVYIHHDFTITGWIEGGLNTTTMASAQAVHKVGLGGFLGTAYCERR